MNFAFFRGGEGIFRGNELMDKRMKEARNEWRGDVTDATHKKGKWMKMIRMPSIMKWTTAANRCHLLRSCFCGTPSRIAVSVQFQCSFSADSVRSGCGEIGVDPTWLWGDALIRKNPGSLENLCASGRNLWLWIANRSRTALRLLLNCSQIASRMTRKWPENDPKMIRKWSKNDPKMIQKWSKNDPKMT